MSSEAKNILFRADSSSLIGTGHIMRDLVLAQKYVEKDNKIFFATQELEGNINHKILEAKYKLNILKSNNLEELNNLIKKLNIDMIVIDHYKIDYKFEKKLKQKNPNLKIFVFDDTYEKHHCDILLNHNISANKKKYKNLVPKNCKLKCGSKYTLLRDEFLTEKKIDYELKKIKTIFIAMGGADSYNINVKILKNLANISNIKINLVTTSANKNLEKLKKYSKSRKYINLHINSNKIAKLMKESDLGIVTPSVIVNEIINLEIPFISIMVTHNQMDMYSFLKKNDFYVLQIDEIESLKKYIKTIFLKYKKERKKIRKILK